MRQNKTTHKPTNTHIQIEKLIKTLIFNYSVNKKKFVDLIAVISHNFFYQNMFLKYFEKLSENTNYFLREYNIWYGKVIKLEIPWL